MMVVRMRMNNCVNCGHPCDSLTDPISDVDTMPSPGDIIVCFYCGEPQAFQEDMRPRRLTQKEAASVANDPTLIELQKMRQRYNG
jgi:hypothetical protein